MHIAMRNLPDYGNPEANNAWHLNIGLDTPDAIMKMFADIRANRLPENPQIYVSTPTLLDHSTAPKGVHSGLVWQLAPYALNGDADNWTQPFKKELEAKVLRTWSSVSPNLGEGNVIGTISFSPRDLEQKFTSMPRGAVYQGGVLPNPPANGTIIEELLDYRTPIEGLYVAGAATHPAGGILGVHGYNVANVMANDLGVNRWWGAAN
jgi:phytoene dehydrogenase-like protein